MFLVWYAPISSKCLPSVVDPTFFNNHLHFLFVLASVFLVELSRQVVCRAVGVRLIE